jgi:rhodanese-related sulfurtransferase
MSKRNRSHRKAASSPRRKAHRSNSALWIGIVVVAVLILAAVLIFRPQPSTPAASQPATINVSQAYQDYQNGVFFLDVREPDEWNAFHIPDATLIPLGQLAGRVDELPRDQPIVVVCRSGNRSQQGRDILLAAGFADVTSMSGGVTAWSNAGYPIEGTRP